MRASKYAIEISKLHDTQVLVIHVISKLPSDYEYSTPTIIGSSIQTYFEEINDHIQLWFNPIIAIAKREGVGDIETDIFMDVKSVADAIIDYATN